MSRPGIVTPVTPELVRGAIELQHAGLGLRPHRLPAWARAQANDGQLSLAQAQPSGVRVVFRTEATAIELDVLATKVGYAGLAGAPDGAYDLVVDGRLAARATAPDGQRLTIDLVTGGSQLVRGPVSTVAFAAIEPGRKLVEVWLPYTEMTELVALRTDAPIEPADDGRPTWLHHGSSISHGASAASSSLRATAAGAGRTDQIPAMPSGRIRGRHTRRSATASAARSAASSGSTWISARCTSAASWAGVRTAARGSTSSCTATATSPGTRASP